MRKLSGLLVLALLVLMAAASVAEAKGGRTSAADCKAGSTDPDCPDEPDAKDKPPARFAAVGPAMPHRAPARVVVA